MIKEKVTIRECQYNDVYAWLKHKHYAKRIPSMSYAFGLYENNILNGVCTYGKPASHSLCKGVCGTENSDLVYELNRLCVNDGLNRNTLSYFLAKTLKMLPRPKIIVSYADTAQNHIGYIYQATNWIYTGLTTKRKDRYDSENSNKHSRHTKKSKKYIELPLRERSQKHRYVYIIGDKRQKRTLRRSLKYEIKEYPKGFIGRYDASFKPETQCVMF